LCAAALLSALPSLADSSKTWTTSGTPEFAAGKLEGVSVLSTGELQLAPQMDKVEGLKATFVWDAKVAPDGSVYVATGSPGAVWRVSGGRAQLVVQTKEEHVLSVLPLADGTVLAGTAPNGIILRINRRGEAQTFVDLPDSYVWGMALGPDDQIYAATGPNGRLLRINHAAQVTERLKVKQHNVTCVVVDKDDTVYAGTDTDGYIYSVPREGKATVIYDAEESEVHCLAVSAKGVLYAGTAQGSSGEGPKGDQDSSQSGSLPTPAGAQGAPSAPNSVYRIVPGEGATRVVRFDRMFVLSLGLVGERLLIGTGPGGRLFALDGDGVSRILAQEDTPHITAIAVAPDGQATIGGSNSGALWSLKKDLSEKGTYVSKPFDADYLAKWGLVKWRVREAMGQDVRLKLRTGNSGEPDETWSDWSDWATKSAGQSVEVPLGRFAQFSAELSTHPRLESPALVAVEVSYKQTNRRPVIEDITYNGVSVLKADLRPGGGPPQGAPPSSPQGRSGRRPTERAITWKAGDPNDDTLIYDLYYRSTDEREWLTIKKDVTDTNLTWDTSRVPDGLYQIKLVASDRPDRGPKEAQEDSRVSFPLLIDNTPPTADKLRADRQADGSYTITGRAVDNLSPIKQIQVSDNSGDWKPVFPDDGILDSPREDFTYTTDKLTPGEHVFVFAVTDGSDNAGSGKVIVEVPGPAK
jgi:sugar lactone lactonase YvrE